MGEEIMIKERDSLKEHEGIRALHEALAKGYKADVASNAA